MITSPVMRSGTGSLRIPDDSAVGGFVACSEFADAMGLAQDWKGKVEASKKPIKGGTMVEFKSQFQNITTATALGREFHGVCATVKDALGLDARGCLNGIWYVRFK